MVTRFASHVKTFPTEARTRTQILSVVCALTGCEFDFPSALEHLHTEVNGLSVLTEIVVILNGPDRDAVSLLSNLTKHYEHLQVYVTKSRVDYSTALLAGIENAIGDWVATIDIQADEPIIIRRLFESALREHADVALSVSTHQGRSLLDAVISGAFHRVFRAFHGFSLTAEAPSARLLSRAVVNSLLCDDSPLIAFETLTARIGYRRCLVPAAQRNVMERGFQERVYARWRTFIGIDAAPLRLANLLSGIGAVGGLSYSLCIMLIYLIKKDVVPGWTTLSLMQSCMFMMLTLVLWLLSEYMLLLLDPAARRPRYEIVDEFGGQVRSQVEMVNVETEL